MRGFERLLFTAAILVLATFAVPGLAVAGQADGSAGCSYPYTGTDATGTNVTVESAPDSVVALQPSDAQTMWDIGARDQVVAMPRTQYTSYLNATDDRIGVKNDDGSVNVEVVTNTSADLVLAANATQIGTVRQLRQAGMTVYHFDRAKSIDDVFEQVTRIGRLTGNCQGANETVSSMQSTIRTVERAVEDRERPGVLYYFFEYTTGSNTHVHDLIRTAGGTNLAAEAGLTDYRPVNDELVAARDPQWIVYPSDARVPTGAPFDGTAAVQQNQTLSVNSNYVSQPGPRIVRPLVTMAEAFHPGAFPVENGSTATAQATTTAVPTTTVPPTTTAAVTEATATTGQNGPGFGVLGTVGAVLALGALGFWRR